MLGLVVGHCYLCCGRDRRPCCADPRRSDVCLCVCCWIWVFIGVGSVYNTLVNPYVVKISLVLCAFFPSLFFERFYRSELRLAALYDITQRIQSWKWNKICAVTLFWARIHEFALLTRLHSAELWGNWEEQSWKKNYTCIASPTSTSPSFLHHLSNVDVQIHFAVPHSGVTRHVRMLYYLKNGLIFSIKGIFLKVYCKFYYLYMGFFLLVWATICIIHI